MMAEVTITITPDGETTVAVKGMAGSGCKKLTEGIERALGHVKKDVPTSEMFETTEVHNVARNSAKR
jgi:hypothetical protein